MKRAALAIALVLPFVAAPFATRLYAAHLGEQIARRVQAFSRSPSHAAPSDLAQPRAPALAPAPEPAPAPAREPALAPAHGSPPARARGIFVPARIASALTPAHASALSGDPVGDGVRLHGVASLGFGLADGDVLESVAGTPTRSPDAAVSAITSAITSAIGAGRKTVSGVIRRGGERLTLTVELPAAMHR